MKKILGRLLITTIMVSQFAFLGVHKTDAFWGLGDISVDPPNLVQNSSAAVNIAKDVLAAVLKKIATRLGNKVLKKMLNKTVNWAVTGFGPWGEDGGQPFYVQNKDSLIKNIEDQQLIKTIDEIGDSCGDAECPYAKNLARGLIQSHINSDKSIFQEFNLDKYTPTWKAYKEGKFSEGGGWKAFEGEHSNPQNTSFGAYLSATTKVAQKQATSVARQEIELQQNSGFLSLRKCVEYADGKAQTSEIDFSNFVSKSEKQTQTSTSGGIAFGGGPDMCPNIAGYQATVPAGQMVDIGGNCVATSSQGEYSNTKPYLVNDVVSFKGNIFKALKETTGNTPSYGNSDNDYWAFTGSNKTTGGQALAGLGNDFTSAYALPGATVDNCIRYETTTPGSMAKEMLGKTLTANIDKSIADTSTGNSLLDSIVDMASVFITNGLDKMITKATTKTSSEQKIYNSGFDTVTLGSGTGTNENSAWYSDNGKDPVVIQSPYDERKVSKEIEQGIIDTQAELDIITKMLVELRASPARFQQLDECLPGPDVGWDQRLKDEFQRSSKRLDKKSQKDNAKGDKAQDATTRLEHYLDQEISGTKIQMMTIIPSAIPILGKMSTITTLSSDLNRAQKEQTKKITVIATLNGIKLAVEAGQLSSTELVELKKQYSGIRNLISREETIQDTEEDYQKILGDYRASFDWSNPRSLISKCVQERKEWLTDIQVGEDLGDTLMCNWQTHNVESHRTLSNFNKFVVGQIGTALTGGLASGLGLSVDDPVVATAGIGSSPYDPGRYVQIYIGDLYTQDLQPFDKGGKDAEFAVDCNRYYRASQAVYEDAK